MTQPSTDPLPDGPLDPRRIQAVALRYEKERKTPIVVAKGSGAIAEEILRRAKEAGVFVHSSRELIDLLMKVDLDARIPPPLYAAVAKCWHGCTGRTRKPAPVRRDARRAETGVRLRPACS